MYFKMKTVFIIVIKSSYSYFMTSIKGRNFRHNGLMLLCLSMIFWKYRPFIKVINYSPLHFISTLNFLSVQCFHGELVMLLRGCIYKEGSS